MKLFPSTVMAAALLAAFGAAPLTAGAATPTYSWSTAKIGGTGFVDGMLAHVGSKGLFYARTDVGGAYRYDVTTSTWIALNDWLPPALHHAYGVDTIAVDPNNSSKFYMIGGINFGNGIDNKAVFLSSNDQGRTFSTLTLPFTAGGNEGGRQVGERLQVDPTFGSILLYGTANSTVNASNNGIWKSTDSGQHWSRLANFNVLTSDGTGAGVAFIAFKPNATNGNPSQVIYAGVNTQSAANAKNLIYKSTDGGNTWAAVWSPAGAGLYPQHGQIGPDGYLYVTFARTTASNPTSAGPGDLTDGEVWKINVGSGQDQWTNITPPGASPRPYGFGGLSVDPWRGGWLTVNTSNIYSGNGQSAETVYRSVDGGVTWSDILAHSTFDATLEPWRAAGGTVTGFGNWTNTLLDPYDSNHAFVSSGGGIWETKNLSAASTTWTSGDVGIEETAMLDLMSPTPNVWNAYPLLSGAGDVCGFVHYDVKTAPPSNYRAPTCKNTSSLDFAKTDSRLVVRVGTDDWANPKHFGAISYNGGYSWNAFGSNGPSANGDGHVAISTDPSTNITPIIWTNPTAPSVRSTDMGGSWQTISVPQGALLASDGLNPNWFYAYDRPSGIVYISSNKGATWSAANTTGSNNVPAWSDKLVAPVGIAGDVWLVNFQGLFHNTNFGQGTWTKLPIVESGKTMGFGKAAPGATYPAMYLAGSIGGTTGIYRSTDAGGSWVRIDDAQHQYGVTDVITGDPKVFGTVYVKGRGVHVGTSSN